MSRNSCLLWLGPGGREGFLGTTAGAGRRHLSAAGRSPARAGESPSSTGGCDNQSVPRPAGQAYRQEGVALLYRRVPRMALWAARRAGSGRIAQLVEQLTLNQRVAGSSPAAPTKPFKGLGSGSSPISREKTSRRSDFWRPYGRENAPPLARANASRAAARSNNTAIDVCCPLPRWSIVSGRDATGEEIALPLDAVLSFALAALGHFMIRFEDRLPASAR
jgi:hypothetical protein